MRTFDIQAALVSETLLAEPGNQGFALKNSQAVKFSRVVQDRRSSGEEAPEKPVLRGGRGRSLPK